MQNAPSVLGDVSPTLAWQNAATRSGDTPLSLGPVPSLLPVPLPLPLPLLPLLGQVPAAQRSVNCAAAPLLSPLTSSLVLFMEVPCTGNHEKAPTALQTPKHLADIRPTKHTRTLLQPIAARCICRSAPSAAAAQGAAVETHTRLWSVYPKQPHLPWASSSRSSVITLSTSWA
jgi:hypothetical protein